LNPLQPRRGGRIALRARTAGLLVYSLHLESSGDDEQRTSQLNQVLADQSRHRAEPAAIAGDFNNAMAFQSFMFAGLAPAGFTDAPGNTSGEHRRSSMNHRHPIDWLFVKGAASASGCVERIDDASDHYPIVATLSSALTAEPAAGEFDMTSTIAGDRIENHVAAVVRPLRGSGRGARVVCRMRRAERFRTHLYAASLRCDCSREARSHIGHCYR